MASRAIHLTNPPDHISDLSEPFRSGPTTKPTAIMPPTRTRGVAGWPRRTTSPADGSASAPKSHLIPPIVSEGGGEKETTARPGSFVVPFRINPHYRFQNLVDNASQIFCNPFCPLCGATVSYLIHRSNPNLVRLPALLILIPLLSSQIRYPTPNI